MRKLVVKLRLVDGEIDTAICQLDRRSKRLTDCGRNRFSAPLDDGRIVVIKVLKGGAEVVILDSSGKPLRTLYRATAGESLTGLAARGDSVVVTMLRGEQWSLVDVGGADPEVLVSELSVASEKLQGKAKKKGHKARNRVILLTGVTLGVLYNPWTGEQTREWIMDRVAGGNGTGIDDLEQFQAQIDAEAEQVAEAVADSGA